MPKSPQRYARPIRRHSGGVASYVRTHRVRALAALAVAITVVMGTVAITNASAEETIPVGAVRAESFADQQGVQLEGTADVGGGKNVGWLANGDWMRYNGLDLGPAGGLTTSVRVAAASNDGGTVELRVDSPTGQLIASIPIKATGGWQAWVTKSDTQSSPGGKHDVFLFEIENFHQLQLGMVDVDVGNVDLVKHRNDLEMIIDGQKIIGDGLRFDALGHVNDKQGPLAGLQGFFHFVGEINMTRRVDEVHDIVLTALGMVNDFDGGSLDRDATLLLEVHVVEKLVVKIAFINRARFQKKAVGQGRFTVVDVRDDRKITDELLIHGI